MPNSALVRLSWDNEWAWAATLKDRGTLLKVESAVGDLVVMTMDAAVLEDAANGVLKKFGALGLLGI